LRDDNFTTILGAELSSAPWDKRDCYWVTAAGLPLDFGGPQPTTTPRPSFGLPTSGRSS
jgi:hypothetical protein